MGQAEGKPHTGIADFDTNYDDITTWAYVETLYGRKSDKGWSMAGDVSSHFLYVFRENWADSMHVSYFATFWKPVTEALAKVELEAVEVDVLFGYAQATGSKDRVADWLDEWRSDKVVHRFQNAIAVEEREDDQLVALLVQLIQVKEIRPLATLEI